MPEDLLSGWLYQRTGRLYQVDEQAAQEAIQFLDGMVTADKSMARPPKRSDSIVIPVTGEGAAFESGRAGMTEEYLSVDRQRPFQVGYAPLPALAGAKPYDVALATPLAIAANTKVPEAAWTFLRYAAGPEGAAIVAKTGALPWQRTPEAKQAFLDARKNAPGLADIFDTPWQLAPLADGAAFAEYLEVQRAAGEVLSGSKSLEEAMAR